MIINFILYLLQSESLPTCFHEPHTWTG